MTTTKVHFVGGDGIGWVLEDDLRIAREALKDRVIETTLEEADIVHSVWWERLLALPPNMLGGKRVVCHIPAEPRRYLTVPAHRHVIDRVGIWVTQNTQASRQLQTFGLPFHFVPYSIATDVFFPVDAANRQEERSIREIHNIPDNTYLIGSFQRDTEGADLTSPKLVKGPDIFLEIMRGLKARGLPFHVVLAGPRRHWIRRQLSRAGIPYSFVGQETDGDDSTTNNLPQTVLNTLYNMVDGYLVSSRSEGGPRAIMEAAATGCAIASTPVGLAPDILHPDCIYQDVLDGIDLLTDEIENRKLKQHVAGNRERFLDKHNPAIAKRELLRLYDKIETVPRQKHIASPDSDVPPPKRSIAQRLIRKVRRKLNWADRFRICLWHQFTKPPYGGGNQFMMALRQGLKRYPGVRVYENRIAQNIDAYVLNSIHFDLEAFEEIRRTRPLPVLHRIDGPIHLIRGFDREKDELCFSLNHKLASATILQSHWTHERILDMGYRPVRPVIIRNAADDTIFHPNGRIPFDPTRKVRLISSSWSDNPRKGGPIYKWLDENLDWARYEYTFVGNASEEFKNIRRIEPVPSRQLACQLRSHDIFITASRNDPCSNAVIEALSCGCPVLYLNDGGHPELVGYGGLPFLKQEEIPVQLDRLVKNYHSFQSLIAVPSLNDVAGQYLEILRDIASHGQPPR